MRCSALVILLIGFLAGCARYNPQPLAPIQSESQFHSRSLTDAGLEKFVARNWTNTPVSWPPHEFDLKSLTLVAFYFHPDIEVGRAQLALAKAGEIVAGERPNPTLSILPEYAINPDVGLSPWVLTVSWDVPIETAGKRGHRISQAKELTSAQELAFAETTWKVRAGVRSALLEKFAADRDLELSQADADLNAQRINLISNRVQFGESPLVELHLAQTDFINSRMALEKASARVVDARLGLASALGLPTSSLEGIQFSWPGFDKPLSPDCVAKDAVQSAGLLNRLDIRRSLKEYAATEAALHLEIANQYPDLHLAPGYQFDQGQHKFSIGPTVALPILNQNQGAIAQAEAKRKQAAASFLALQTLVIQTTEKALSGYHAALSQWKQADSLVADQDKLAKAARDAVELGESDRLALLNAQLQRSTAVRARLEALVKVQESVGMLEDAVQRPICEGQQP